ncbi:MAG: RNA recognition motif domain-containing protein [Chitinispirillaceae bacterium]
MTKKLFLGNLPFSSTEDDVKYLFENYGPVQSANIVIDRETGRSRGYGFIELPEHMAEAAKVEMNGAVLGGRNIRIGDAFERGVRQRKPVMAL